jgi:hypothetical protein
MSIDLRKMTADELRSVLVTNHGYTEQQASKVVGKTNLIYEIKKLEGTVNTTTEPEDTLLNSIELELDKPDEASVVIETINKEQKNIPSYNSADWSDYILSLISQDEFDNGNPKVAGLQRVAQLVLGDIVYSGPVQVFPATDSNDYGRATVLYEIQIMWKLDIPQYLHTDTSPIRLKTFRAVADGYEGNINGDRFKPFPVQIAETRALGRALRRALNLKNVVSAEELSGVEMVVPVTSEYNSEEPMSAVQSGFLKNKCAQLKVDFDKFVPKDSKKSDAAALIKKLSDYQTAKANGNSEEVIPSSLLLGD